MKKGVDSDVICRVRVSKKRLSEIIWFFIGLAMLILIILIMADFVWASIGIEEYNDILHTWNEGIIAPDTYFDMSSGLLQHANTIPRLDDVTYYYGFARRFPNGTYQWIGTDSISANISYASDNTNYWWAAAQKIIVYNGGSVGIRKNHSQNLTSDYVRINWKMLSDTTYSGDYYFFSGWLNMDVGRDNIADKFVITTWDNVYEDYGNRTIPIIIYDVIKVTVVGEGLYNYELDLLFNNHTLLYFPRPGQANGDIYIAKRIGNIQANHAYSISYDWIDATCTKSCAFGCNPIVQQNDTNSNYYQTEKKDFTCSYTTFSLMGSCTCTFTGGACTAGIMQNASSGSSIIKSHDPDRPLKCFNASNCVADFDESFGGAAGTKYKRFAVVGSRDTNEATISKCVLHQSPSLYYYSAGGAHLAKDTIFNLTLIIPENNTNTSNTSIVFQGNTTINYTGSGVLTTVDNITLFLNDTPNVTQSNVSLYNYNLTFDDDLFIGNWTLRMCYSHNCSTAWEGNRELIVMLPIPTSFYSARKMISYFIDRSNLLRSIWM